MHFPRHLAKAGGHVSRQACLKERSENPELSWSWHHSSAWCSVTPAVPGNNTAAATRSPLTCFGDILCYLFEECFCLGLHRQMQSSD